jgi:hypothetical protein
LFLFKEEEEGEEELATTEKVEVVDCIIANIISILF